MAEWLSLAMIGGCLVWLVLDLKGIAGRMPVPTPAQRKDTEERRR